MELQKSISKIAEHVEKLSVIFWGSDVRSDIKRFLRNSQTLKEISKFIESEDNMPLFISKQPRDHRDEETEGEVSNCFKIGSFPSSLTEHCGGFVLVKNEARNFKTNLSECRTTSSVVSCFQIGSHDIMFSVLQNVVRPFFLSSLEKENELRNRDVYDMNGIRNGFRHLGFSLFRRSRSSKVPDFDLQIEVSIHPEIRKFVDDNKPISYLRDLEKSVIDETEDMILSFCRRIRNIVDLVDVETKKDVTDALSEVTFWKDLLSALGIIKSSLGSKYIDASFDFLGEHRRRKSKIIYDGDMSKIIQLENKVSSNCRIFGNLPICEIRTCSDLPKLIDLSETTFRGLRQFKTTDSYPNRRKLAMIQSVFQDVLDRSIHIIESYTSSDKFSEECLVSFFRHLDLQVSAVVVCVVQRLRQRDHSKPVAVEMDEFMKRVRGISEKMEKKMLEIQKIFNFHDLFQLALEKVGKDSSVSEEILEKLENSKKIFFGNKDILGKYDEEDITISQSVYYSKYEETLLEIEGFVISAFRNRISKAKTNEERVSVISDIRPLFFRPSIKDSVLPHQKECLEKIIKDVDDLEEKFRTREGLDDVSDVVKSIRWAKTEILPKLDAYFDQFHSVFGKIWEDVRLLQNADFSWVLSEPLVEILGLPPLSSTKTLFRTKISHFRLANERNQPEINEIIGTSIVVCYLEQFCKESEGEWIDFVELAKIRLKELEDLLDIPNNTVAYAQCLLVEELGIDTKVKRSRVGAWERICRIKKTIEDNVRVSMDDWNTGVRDVLCSGKWGIVRLGLGLEEDQIVMDGRVIEIDNDRDLEDLKCFPVILNYNKMIDKFVSDYEIVSNVSLGIRDLISRVCMKAYINIKDITDYATTLRNSLQKYEKICDSINDKVFALSIGFHKNGVVQSLKRSERSVTWRKIHSLHKSTNQISASIDDFSEKVKLLNERWETIDANLKRLEDCGYDEIRKILGEIQRTIDKMCIEENYYTHIEEFTTGLNEDIEEVLMKRVRDVILAWKHRFSNFAEKEEKEKEEEENNIILPRIVSISIQINEEENSIEVVPSVESVKSMWYSSLNEYVSAICGNDRIHHRAFNKLVEDEHKEIFASHVPTFSDVLSKIGIPLLLREAYGMIESSFVEVKKFVARKCSEIGSRILGWLLL